MRRWGIIIVGLLVGCQAPVVPSTATVAPLAQRTMIAPTFQPPTPSIPEPTPLLGDQLSIAQAWGRIDANTEIQFRPLPPIGTTETFWVSDLATDQAVEISATLVVQTPHLAMYVDTRDTLDTPQLQAVAEQFEEQGAPILQDWFEGVWPEEPVTILHTSLSSAAGYYAVENRLPQSINRYSNQRDMIVVSSNNLTTINESYLATLIHEFQHLLHRRLEPAPATWFNEGMGMFSEYALFSTSNGFASNFLSAPDTQLNNWASEPNLSLKHYGAADLWLRYIHAHSPAGIPAAGLIQADAGDHLEAFIAPIQAVYPDLQTFDDLFATWAVANVLNDPTVADGRYAYTGLNMTTKPVPALDAASGTTQQLGSDYLLWEAAPFTRTIEWTGNITVPILPLDDAVAPVWWSGRGDLRASTLTAAVAVPAQGTQLTYRTWTDLEEHFDYAYLTVSTDNGTTWNPIKTSLSSEASPYGLNVEQGWTGQHPWETVQVDLSPWSGQAILVRFWMISDQAYQANGVVLDDLSIDGVDVVWSGNGWNAITNQLNQEWELRGILQSATTIVEPLTIREGHTTWIIPANTQAILMIAATTAETTQAGQWSYRVR